jgi:TRAP-type C4-dicarboxylate transport system substrate-binding protein
MHLSELGVYFLLNHIGGFMRRFFFLISLFLAPVMFWPGGAYASSTLSYSTFFPSTHIQAQTAQAWCKEVEKRTERRVRINFYPGQTLTKADQTYDSVMDGICDIGTSCLAYTPGRFPVMSAMDLPFGYPSAVAATKAANTLYAQMNPEEFSTTKVMYFNAHGPGYIHTKGEPVRNLDELKGLKIRSTGMSAEVIKALGGSPVSMPMPDTYQALQKGLVEGSIHPIETNKGWNIGEVVDFMTQTDATGYTTTFFVVMNKDKWNSLDHKDQEIISQINQEWALKHAHAWDESDTAGMEFFRQEGGEVITLSEEENAKWSKTVAPVIKAYKQKLNAQGYAGDAVITTIEESLHQLK